MHLAYEDVHAFLRKFKPEEIGKAPAFPPDATRELWWALLAEESGELHGADLSCDLVAFADAIGDTIYVLVGMAIVHGIDLRPVWDAIQRANMAKEGGGRRADGKILKPPGWKPPDIAGILASQTRAAS